MSLMEEQASEPTLKEKFFATFLPGKLPRRIQSELWDRFEAICAQSRSGLYKGIVQWATGCGKTIAMLLLFVLSANRCKQQNRIFRGLLVAPTNDIFNTILSHIRTLSLFGIQVCEGHDGQLSSLSVPSDRPILLITTHAALTNRTLMNSLPPMTHVHYDEVHRITGEEFFNNLNDCLPLWETEFLTGTSATPRTCSPSQHRKLAALFGDPFPLLHRCDIDEAIHEKWIAQPRFSIHVVSKTKDKGYIIDAFLLNLRQAIAAKQAAGQWRGGKVIAYLPSIEEVSGAVQRSLGSASIYAAVKGTEAQDDSEFVKAPADGTVRILFACERYREGSDIFGLEMTVLLMGNTIAANILLQVAGRALRLDYAGKEGWCSIIKPCEEGTTEDEVFESIMLYIMEFLNKSEGVRDKRQIQKLVEHFLGNITVNGKLYDIEETTNRIQALYVRREFERSAPKEKYFLIRQLNQDLCLTSMQMYQERSAMHPKYIADPHTYFKDSWTSWYHFLGIPIHHFPVTKADFIEECKVSGFYSKPWDHYKEKRGASLPEEPGQMYEDFTNWDKEMGVEEEMVW